MFSSTFPDDAAAGMHPPPQNTYADPHAPHVDPIARRPPGPFPHRPPSAAVYDPQTFLNDTYPSVPRTYSQPMSSAVYNETPMSGSPSYSQENSLAAAIPSSSTSPHHMSSCPTSEYAMYDRWAHPYISSLESAPLISQDGDTQWTQTEIHQPLDLQSNESPAGAPQIYVTPVVHQSGVARPYYYSSPTPPSMHQPDEVELSSPPRQSRLTSNMAPFPTSPSMPQYTSTDYYRAAPALPTTRTEPGCSDPYASQRISPDPQSGNAASLHVLKVVQTRDLPRLETTRLEPRTRDPAIPGGSQGVGSRWFIQTTSPLLTPPDHHTGESRLPRSPQQASPYSSSNSSLTSPSPSSPMTFVAFAPTPHGPTGNHVITEDKSISEMELNQIFPPSSQGPMEASSPKGTPSRKWTCQLPGCFKSVRRQDRMAHALEHHGKKRYICNCGASFARSQDQKRHLREQAVCRSCERAVGRNGWNGVCPACSPRRRRRSKKACSVSDGSA